VSKDNIIQLIHPGNVEDQPIEILRNGARVLFAQALEAEGRGPSRKAYRF
jgi:putative transposase